MGDILIFFILAIGMFCLSYLCGYAPIYISSKLDNASNIGVYGAGVMLGTSLLLIIPQGVSAMYHASISYVKMEAELTNRENSLISELEYRKIGKYKANT